MKKLILLSGSFICLLFFAVPLHAQDKVTIVKGPKFKPPVVQTSLGLHHNGDMVTADEAVRLVALPLEITDKSGVSYAVDTYRFLYRQKNYFRDEETGRPDSTFSIVADRFSATPLPEIWIDNIRARLQKGEQLYFFDIIVKDKQGRIFFAPEIKITVQ